MNTGIFIYIKSERNPLENAMNRLINNWVLSSKIINRTAFRQS